MQTTRVAINYTKVVNSEKGENHYLILGDKVPFGEVSGDLIEVLDINICGVDEKAGPLLSTKTITKMGLNPEEARGRYKAFKEKLGNLSHIDFRKEAKEGKKLEYEREARERERKRIESDYLNSCQRRRINFGAEKMMCIREWLMLTKGKIYIGKFQGEALERTRRYGLQNL